VGRSGRRTCYGGVVTHSRWGQRGAAIAAAVCLVACGGTAKEEERVCLAPEGRLTSAEAVEVALCAQPGEEIVQVNPDYTDPNDASGRADLWQVHVYSVPRRQEHWIFVTSGEPAQPFLVREDYACEPPGGLPVSSEVVVPDAMDRLGVFVTEPAAADWYYEATGSCGGHPPWRVAVWALTGQPGDYVAHEARYTWSGEHVETCGPCDDAVWCCLDPP
jgi:hypothetical protein